MRILVVQHDREDPTGVVGESLAARGAELVTTLPHLGQALPAGPDGYDGLLLMGGPMCAADDKGHPYFPDLHGLVRRFHDSGRPILGICLGAQIIARAFGKRVYRNPVTEIGFRTVRLTKAGAADPMFSGFGELRPMQWHEDTFEMPKDATHLAENDECRNQAYRIGAGTYAVQFHPEVTRPMVRSWAKSPSAKSGTADRLEDEMNRYLPAAEKLGRTMGERWGELVERHARRSAA